MCFSLRMLLKPKQIYFSSILILMGVRLIARAEQENQMSADLILLTGSSGLIGNSLIRTLRQNRISTFRLHRNLSTDSGGAFWDPYATEPVHRTEALEGITAAVHLSGANVAARWTPSYKRTVLKSRVTPTHALATLLAGLRSKPAVLVCASAIGIYGGRGDEVLTETSAPGSGFLADVCVAWENATQPAVDAGIRVVHLRIGVVLSSEGGALARMLPVFRAGLGGRLGNGRQWLSWITLPDATRAIMFALETPSLSGPVNLVAPNPVTNVEFARTLGRVLHRPALLPVPALALSLAFGEMAKATILESERVIPERLLASGFRFECPGLEEGLRAVLTSSKE
jgi:uncharacterized protein (TIGR01777 family)